MKTLVENGLFLDENLTFQKKNILIVNDRIKYIGNEKIEADKIIDAKNKIILPGFINGHVHFGECFVRGFENSLNTEEYIKYADNINIGKNQEKIRSISSMMAILENLSYGNTTMNGIRGIEEAKKSKARFYLGYPFMKSNKLGKYLENAFDMIDNFQVTDLISPCIFIHSLTTVDENILSDISQYIKEKDIFVIMHFLETEDERNKIQKKYSLEPLEVLEKYNLLNKKTLLVHCCYITESEMEKIQKNDVSICICPISNAKLGNKVPEVNKILSKKINILLGTDGGATNDSFSLIEEMKFLSLLQHVDYREIYKMVSHNPNKFFMRDIGIIKEGYKADLIFYEIDTTLVSKYLLDLINRGQKPVAEMMINGQHVIRDYNNVFIDRKIINKEKEELVKEIYDF